MTLELAERLVRIAGGLLAFVTLGVLSYGVWRGIQRRPGRTTGQSGVWLRSPWFYLLTSALFFGSCWLGWKPLPLNVSQSTRIWSLVSGALLYFPGMALVLWARLALGENYFPSTALGVQLFSGHRLVTSGPFAILRHPLYAGIILAALGSLLIYSTWTTLFLAIFAALLCLRARREEAALALEFGVEWEEYCRRVPPFLPRWRR